MVEEIELEKLLTLLQPTLLEDEFVFCTIDPVPFGELDALNPLACYHEKEGLSLLLKRTAADEAGIKYQFVSRCITLSVHSSLSAVGFTAAVSSKLAAHGIPANVIAAYYHDHVFVPADRAEIALKLLTEFERRR
ncbi:MAG: ACT domain-containing protein [Gammaproteobacteria bacterium]